MRHRLVSLTGLLLLVANLASVLASDQRLFTIPYGTGKDQVAVPPLEDTESELGAFTQAPATIRRLRTGDFAILSRRHNEGVTLQIFSPEGKLRSYTKLPIDINEAVIDYDGNIYSVSYIFPEDLDKESFLRAFSSDGKPLPLEATRERVASLLKEMKPQFLGTPVACCDGALHIPVYCRSSTETIPKLITITKSGSLEVSELAQLASYPVCLPGCEIGILEYSSPEGDTEIILRRKSGAEIARAAVDTGLVADLTSEGGVLFLNHDNSFVAKDNHLVVPFLVSYKNEDKTLGFPKHTNIFVILDSKGKVIMRVPFDTPVGTHRAWDTDSEGNVYYLAFTKEGAEMRKLTIR